MKLKIGLIGLILALSIPIAFGASTTYYAKTTVYFNVPSDASFSIAMPANYGSWTSVTGTTEGGATATDWISFNFTNVPQATLQEPYQLGVSGNNQAGAAKPIFYIDNTGNVNEKFEINLSTAVATGIGFYFNATCTGSCTTPTTTLTEFSSGNYQQLVASLPTTSYLNITLYGNTSSSAAAGTTSNTVYIKSTAV